MKYQDFYDALKERRKWVQEYLFSSPFASLFASEHIRDAVYSYMRAGGKSLRPAVLLFSCGAVGGDEKTAIPAAAAIEVFHTWTLVHDDIIDRDRTRRGVPTVHEEFRQRAIAEMNYDDPEAVHYGRSIAMLAGDMQQGWAVSILAELTLEHGIPADVALYLIHNSEMHVLSTLIDGEIRDIQYSKRPVSELDESLILDMLWKKTGVLYEFSGKAGAMIGLGISDPEHELVQAISSFAGKCGIAFQLQDDILGIVGSEQTLGKPVGSDVREGKRTTIVYYAFKQASSKERQILSSVLGNPQATQGTISQAIQLLRDSGGVEYTSQLAQDYIQDAIRDLSKVPDSPYKAHLAAWADYMIERKF